eukprot:1481285-Amphidinium_carterae.1
MCKLHLKEMLTKDSKKKSRQSRFMSSYRELGGGDENGNHLPLRIRQLRFLQVVQQLRLDGLCAHATLTGFMNKCFVNPDKPREKWIKDSTSPESARHLAKGISSQFGRQDRICYRLIFRVPPLRSARTRPGTDNAWADQKVNRAQLDLMSVPPESRGNADFYQIR